MQIETQSGFKGNNIRIKTLQQISARVAGNTGIGHTQIHFRIPGAQHIFDDTHIALTYIIKQTFPTGCALPISVTESLQIQFCPLVQISSFSLLRLQSAPLDVCYQAYCSIIIGNVKYRIEFVSAVLRRQNGDSYEEEKKQQSKSLPLFVSSFSSALSHHALSAIFAFPGWQRLFSGCLICTVAVPILLWIFIWLYGQFEQKHRSHPSISDRPTQAARRTRTRQMLRRTKTQKCCCTGNYFPGSSTFQLSYTLFYASTASFSFSALSS